MTSPIRSHEFLKDILAHQNEFSTQDLTSLTKQKYHAIVHKEAFFYRHCYGIRHTFSDEILATNKIQVDILISHLKKLRDEMPD